MVPFTPEVWPTAALRLAAERLWAWNRSVRSSSLSEATRMQAHEVCRTHNLPVELLTAQQEGVLASQPGTFANREELMRYIDEVMGSHAILLAKLGGERSRWVQQPVQAFARAAFMTRRLCQFKEDLNRKQLWIPQDVLLQADVEQTDLEQGVVTTAIRRLLWKQVVLTRDAYAGCRTLTTDFSGWLRRRFRICWTQGVHLLALIEARRFDVWSKPVELTGLRKLQLYWQVYIGKTFR